MELDSIRYIVARIVRGLLIGCLALRIQNVDQQVAMLYSDHLCDMPPSKGESGLYWSNLSRILDRRSRGSDASEEYLHLSYSVLLVVFIQGVCRSVPELLKTPKRKISADAPRLHK